MNDCAAIGNITVSIKRSYNVYVGGFAGRLIAGSLAKNCVYVPGEAVEDESGVVTADGVKITLMGESGTKEDNVTVQKAYVGLTVGYMDSQSKVDNVFAYADKFACDPQPAETNQIVINDSVVSTDLSKLPDAIKDLIK